jgi:hypothetical protein
MPPATKRLAGKLIDSQPSKEGNPIWNLVHRVEVPVVGASLILQDPVTDRTYSTGSGSDGSFIFGGVPNGTYVLHIEGGTAGDQPYDATDELIALNPAARFNSLLFTRTSPGGGGCGGTSLVMKLSE